MKTDFFTILILYFISKINEEFSWAPSTVILCETVEHQVDGFLLTFFLPHLPLRPKQDFCHFPLAKGYLCPIWIRDGQQQEACYLDSTTRAGFLIAASHVI